MDNTVHGLREFFTDPRRAGAVRVGGGAFCIVLLAALVWIALAQGLGWLGSRLQNGQTALYVTLFAAGVVIILRTLVG